MKKSRFGDEQIAEVLASVRAGRRIAEVCKEAGISEPTFYRWKAKFDGAHGRAQRLTQLEVENRRLKDLVAELSLDNHTLRGALLHGSAPTTERRNS